MPVEVPYIERNLAKLQAEISSIDLLKLVFSNDTIELLNQYTRDRKAFIEHQKLWNQLLLDSICILKINDLRERYNFQFSKLYNVDKNITHTDQFKTIRTYCTYGIQHLDGYFKAFVNFEGVLYGTDKNYRDHVNHVIQVWLMGIYFLNNNIENFTFSNGIVPLDIDYSFQIDEKIKLLIEDTKNNPENEYTELSSLFITKSEMLASWTIIALCHDLGYPIEKATKLNEQFKNILRYFGASKFDEFHFDFGLLNQFLVKKYLDFISSKSILIKTTRQDFNYKEVGPEENSVKDYLLNAPVGYTALQPKYKDKFAKSLEEFKHGIFSGLLIFKTLTYFLESDYTYDKSLLPGEDLRQFNIRKEILRSISSHTCPNIYHLEIKNLSFLLVVCDELQEWDRPNFDDLRTQPDDDFIEMNVDTFNFSDPVELRLSLTYKSHGEENLPSIKHKLRMLHNLLRSAKDDSNRSFIFRWKIKFKDEITNHYHVYRFRFDSHGQDDIETIKITEYDVDEHSNKDNEQIFDIFTT